MNKEQIIDEIDWLIFELKSGVEISVEHYVSLDALGIDFPYTSAERARFGGIIGMLKNKREKLI